MKKLGGGTRLALAQFRELEAFSQFASDLDDATRKQLERGQRITELMKQKQYSPFSVAEMGLSLFVVEKGYLDDIPVNEVSAFEASLHDYMRSTHAALLKSINAAGGYDNEIEAQLSKAVEEFKRTASW
jgi:F-type H+-transporting ATPase subunit alpha